MYKFLFWLLMFVIYLVFIWLIPLLGAPEGYEVGNVIVAHLVLFDIFLVFVAGRILRDKSFK